MSAKFMPHRCGRVMISIGGKVRELTLAGYETDKESEIAEIRSSRIFGVWVTEIKEKAAEIAKAVTPKFEYAEPEPIPTLDNLTAMDIIKEEEAIAEQVAIREEQEKAERIEQEISLEVDEGVKREIKSRKPGGKDPAGGKSKKSDKKPDEAPKRRGRPPKAN